MEQATFSKYSWIDFVFSVVGVCTFLVDWGSDVWVATEFYCRGDFLWFGVLVGLMVLSSVVVQMFSWFWLKYDRELPGFSGQTGGGTVLFGDRVELSCLLHVLQLGFLCRKLIKELDLEGKVTTAQVSKKWENLKKIYKDLKTPKTGSGTDSEEVTAATWIFYEDMHVVLGDRPSVQPPVLVASYEDPTQILS